MLHRETEPQTLKNLHFLDKNDQTLYNFICGPSATKLLLYNVHVQCTMYTVRCTMYIVKWKLRCRVQRDHTYLCVHKQGV